MRVVERQMLDLLKRGRQDHGFLAVKAEFEAEGTRVDEFLRLLELARKADLKVALKIGGCEAVSDLQASRLYGADYIIAPMVETDYALSKFVDAFRKVYAEEEREDTSFLFNLETETTFQNLAGLRERIKSSGVGVVFGRVDFTLSRGLPRKSVNQEEITAAVLDVAGVCRDLDCELVVGGSVSVEAMPVLKRFREVRLDRFETRKVVFDGMAAVSPELQGGIQTAVNFELLWLKSKQAYYGRISAEDASRIAMMEARVS